VGGGVREKNWEEGVAAWEKSCAVFPAGCWEVFPAVVVMPAVVGGAIVTVVAAASAEKDK